MIQIKCNNCGNEFSITKDKCPFCNDPVKTKYKLYCGTCENEIKLGELICSKCNKKPDEIIIEKSNGERIRTEFDTGEEDIENIYKSKVRLIYMIIPQILYWIIPVIYGILLANEEMNFCIFGCDAPTPKWGISGFIIAIIAWLFFTWPILFIIIIKLWDKFMVSTNFDKWKNEITDIKVKCNKCHKEYYISRGMKYCPKCGNLVGNTYSLYCNKCNNKFEPGEIICKECIDIPKKIYMKYEDKKSK